MKYTHQEKAAIIVRFQAKEPVQALCAEYGISRSTLYRWANVHCAANPGSARTFTIKEYDMLQRRVNKLENVISVLKNVNCTTASPLKEKLRELHLLYGQYDIHTLCEALDVPRGTFYNYIFRGKQGSAWYDKRREEYRVLIQDVFNEYRQVLGAEKIRTILVERGHQISKSYVADLMQEMGLTSVRTTAKKDYLKRQASGPKKNILRQRFYAERPNQIWVSDITYFKLEGHHFYVCVIIDLFSRKIVGYKVSKKNSTQLVTSTFKQACTVRKPSVGLVFHSDRGTQYTSHRFQQLMQEHAVIQSFSKTGRPHDNAVAESFFASFKKEELYRENYHSENAFRTGIDAYIVFYNDRRPHQTLKNLTPSQVEGKFKG